MWESIRKFITNPRVQGLLVAVAVALVEALVGESETKPPNSQ